MIFEVKAGKEKQQGETELLPVYHTGGAKTGKRSNFHMSNFPDLEMLLGHSFGVSFGAQWTWCKVGKRGATSYTQMTCKMQVYFATTCTCSCTHDIALCTGNCKCASLIEKPCELSGWSDGTISPFPDILQTIIIG